MRNVDVRDDESTICVEKINNAIEMNPSIGFRWTIDTHTNNKIVLDTQKYSQDVVQVDPLLLDFVITSTHDFATMSI